MSSRRYGDAWRKTRKATLRGQPLCALCLVGGKVVPAVIVDHKVPLEDGGTNAQENLQPLCKRCHDAVKTPADVNERKKQENASVVLHVAWIGTVDAQDCWDMRPMRRQLAKIHGWVIAHELINAAAYGVAALQLVDKAVRPIVVVIDDCGQAKIIKARTGVKLAIEPEGKAPRISKADEDVFLVSRYELERQARRAVTNGHQQSFAHD